MTALPVDDILQFWFGDKTDDADIAKAQNALWWEKNNELDKQVKAHFGYLLPLEMRGEFDVYKKPRELLARIITCDQFPRNMYRGTVDAFAYDEHARFLANQLIAAGDDAQLRFIERTFAYLPFEHSENLTDQHLSVQLYTGLLMQVPSTYKSLFTEHLQFAMRHRDIIYDFGRFPHRNSILGRPSTDKEIAFLNTPNSAF
jgi:uncharacterized protein (DUF924 family)